MKQESLDLIADSITLLRGVQELLRGFHSDSISMSHDSIEAVTFVLDATTNNLVSVYEELQNSSV